MKIRWGLLLLVFMLVFTACEEQLSTDPEDRIVPKTVEDYHGVMVGGLPGVYHAFTELLTDNLVAKYYPSYNNPQTYSEWRKAYLWIDQTSSDESSSPEYAWRWYYADIYKLNLVINNVMDAEGDPAFAAHIKGEALVTRAYSYFMLVNLFAKQYDANTAATDLGVPLNLEALDAGFHQFTRNTVQEVYDQIEEDLLDGIELIDDKLVEKPMYHFTTVSALAFASRFYLYKGDYQQTIEYSNLALDINPILLDHNEFPDMENNELFEPLEHANNYFTTERDNIYMLRSGFFAPNYYRSGYYSNEFKDIYEFRDLRGVHNFTYTNPSAPNYITLKLSLSHQQYNYPLFRSEEMILNKAEAYARLGGNTNIGEAIRSLNKLRIKRFKPSYYVGYKFNDFANQQELIDEVLLERRKELCYEGHRWFDLKREGYPELIHMFNGKEYKLEKNDLRYVLQIPDHELINNPSMEKNPR